MGFGDALSETLNGLLGNVEKAVIRVIDGSTLDESEEIKLESAQENGNDLGVKVPGAPVKSKSTTMKGLMKDAYLGADAVRDSAIDSLAKLHSDREAAISEGRKFTVQFNPSTLRLRASGGGKTEIRNYADKTGKKDENKTIGFSYSAVPFSIHMDVDLIFNKVDPNDAFIEILPSVATFKGATKSVKNLIGMNSSYSVQNEVEGLIATTLCFDTCMMSFNWGKLCYSGVLQNLEANYTVFNPKGEPVAGTVHLSMILIDENVNERNAGKWYEAYQVAFQEKNGAFSKTSKVGSSAFSNFTF